jgi:hypothetical protein
MKIRYEVRIVLLFLVLLLAYLGMALWLYAPHNYYGEDGVPDFSDPWIGRSQAILNGGVIYRDARSTTPPLTNYLMVIPTVFARMAEFKDPWTTLSFMLFFSLFCLLAAFVLFYMGATRKEGWYAAALFLLNPLTFGNAVLRRQDEAILVFFVGLALLFIIKNKHIRGGIGIGAAVLIKLGAVALIPVALLHRKKWHYAVIPIVVCALAFLPFLMLAGESAMIWRTGERHNEHLFQFGGVALVHMFNAMHNAIVIDIKPASALLIAGSTIALALVCWKRFGILEDITLFLGAVLVFSPKLHTGYFSLLVFTMAPLVKSRWMMGVYLFSGLLAMTADFCKYPIRNYAAAFWLMLATALLIMTQAGCFAYRRLKSRHNRTCALNLEL